MQDPLKNNKAFKESYLSYQAHKKYLTPYNVDSLVYSLHQIKEQAAASTDRQECGFVDTYIQSTLPSVIHKPLVAEVKPWMKHTDTLPSSHSSGVFLRHSTISESKSCEKPLLKGTTHHNRTSITAGKTHQSLWGPICQRERDYYHQSEHTLDMPLLESSSSLKTKPDSMLVMTHILISCFMYTYYRLTMRCSLPFNDEAVASSHSESEDDDTNEVDSGWQDQEEEDGLLSDIEKYEPYCSSRETWEYESSEGDTSDSGQFQSGSLSPLHEIVDLLPSMIPPRLTYPGEREDGISLPLTPSVFHNLPPTIHFPLPNEKCEYDSCV